MTNKILLIEDDPIIASEIKTYLETWGYEVTTIINFDQVDREFVECSPHLVLMDITLPFYNGFYWCSEIRKVSNVPILFLSSNSDNMNIIMAINMGGDDFISKPFEFPILSAKIQALLRRSYSFQVQNSLLECNGAILNLSNASLLYQDNKIELTKNEFRILEILLSNKGQTISREAIMKHLWDDDCFIDDNTLAVNFTRLRKKLDENGLINFITTKKGLGYQITEGELTNHESK